jgi:hypothetical protein
MARAWLYAVQSPLLLPQLQQGKLSALRAARSRVKPAPSRVRSRLRAGAPALTPEAVNPLRAGADDGAYRSWICLERFSRSEQV